MARGRKPGVRFFESKNGFFGVVNGKRTRLVTCSEDDAPSGPNFCEALKLWISLTEIHRNKGTPQFTLRALANSYRLYLADAGRSSALRIYGRLETFVDQHGGKPVAMLKAFHFNDWMKAQIEERKWKPNTQRTITDAFQTSMNWAVRSDMIQSNPFARKLKPPPPQGRGRESLIPAALMDIMIESVSSVGFAAMLRVMRATGCRPEEIQEADIEHYKAGRITFRFNAPTGYRHKQSLRGKKVDRVIYLTTNLTEMIEAHIGNRKSGPIFLNNRGRRFTISNRQDFFARMLRQPAVVEYCKANNLDPDIFVPYHFRHTYISTMLDKGMPIKLLADMCGTSVNMIEQTYGKTNSDNLHDVFNKFQ